MLHDPIFIVAANLSVAVLMRVMKPNLLTAAFMAVVLIGSAGFLGRHHGDEVIRILYRSRDMALTVAGKPPIWPPQKHRTYPDLELIDQDGEVTRLSDFRGRVILVEPVGIPCEACVAYSGGQHVGAFEGVEPQEGLQSIAEYAQEYGGIPLDDSRIVHVQLLLFNHALDAPSEEEAQRWARHFNLDRSQNKLVLVGTPSMATKASRNLIPGFQLIDRDFILRADSTGTAPQDDLYSDLLPMLGRIVESE